MLYNVLLVIHTILVVFLIGVILIQRSEGDGMGLSGGGGNQFLSGRSQANILTRITAILATLFILSSLTLAVLSSRTPSSSILDKATPDAVEGSATSGASGSPEAEKPVAPSVPQPQ